jgi:hypothetical protein
MQTQIFLTVNEEDVDSGDQNKKFVYRSPKHKLNLQGKNIKIKMKNLPCKCAKFVINDDKTYSMIVRTDKITKKDNGKHSFKVLLNDINNKKKKVKRWYNVKFTVNF